MAQRTQQQVIDAITDSISRDMMPLSTLEGQHEELDMAEAAYDAEAYIVGEAASSEHYSSMANRLFSEVYDDAQESKAPSTLAGYQGYLLVNPSYHRLLVLTSFLAKSRNLKLLSMA